MKDGEKLMTFCAIVERKGDLVYKRFHELCRYKERWSAYKMWANEVDALLKVSTLHGLQQYVGSDRHKHEIVTMYAGHQLRRDDMSCAEAERQCSEIVGRLRDAGVVHRDVRPGNLMCRHGIITLIDFQWAWYPGCVFKNEKDAPREMGGRYRQKGNIDDMHSIIKSVRRIWQ